MPTKGEVTCLAWRASQIRVHVWYKRPEIPANRAELGLRRISEKDKSIHAY
jgi:hypothetical protein